MSIFRITPNDLERRKVITSPRRTYVSSSAGVTGSISIFSKVSTVLRDASLRVKNKNSQLNENKFDLNFKKISSDAKSRRALSSTAPPTQKPRYIYDLLIDQKRSTNEDEKKGLLDVFNEEKLEKPVVEIERIVPGDTKNSLFSTTTNPLWYKKFEKAVMSKLQIKDVLMHYYMASYPTCDWAYTNYHSLNFFNAERADGVDLPKDSVLLYPGKSNSKPGKPVNGPYSLPGEFTFDFYINPRYKKDVLDSSGEFKAGTIFHLSSSYALSLITGSKKDENGLPLTFRLMLQLGNSTGIAPSAINPEIPYPNDLIFFSSDDSLKWNEWHRVVVTWPTMRTNNGRGFFSINNETKGFFTIPLGTINPLANNTSLPNSPEDPGTLCIGNFFESTGVGTNGISRFFDKEIARGNGVNVLNETGILKNPTSFNLRHPLKAEVHDLTIRRSYAPENGTLIKKREGNNPGPKNEKDIIFYVPPFFVEQTKMRNKFKTDKTLIDDGAGILQTPSISRSGKTDDPFNIALALGVGGHYINLENFVKDFANNNWPRLFSLTGSIIPSEEANPQNQTANDYLYKQTSVAKRNLTILPCDDGNYTPGFNLLTEEIVKNKYVDFGGVVNYSYINLDKLISSKAYISQSFGAAFDVLKPSYENFANGIIGPTPETPLAKQSEKLKNYISKVEESIDDESFKDPGIQQGAPLMIYQRTKDQSSNQITIFNISNIYYGKKIQPGSFEITDKNLSGSYGQISITLKDDGFGNLYRADSLSTHASFNSVGNIFYDEGVVVIKSPHLYFFGKNEFEMSFRGLNTVYTTKYELLATAGTVNSSSNKTYNDSWDAGARASTDPQDVNEKFVYISDINIHDENMNVIARAKLAQPILKRDRDKILFKIAIDF